MEKSGQEGSILTKPSPLCRNKEGGRIEFRPPPGHFSIRSMAQNHPLPDFLRIFSIPFW